MKFSMSEAWRDATAMMSANREVLLIVAALFFLVPSLVSALAMPDMQETMLADPENASAIVFEMYAGWWWLLLLVMLAQLVGYLALLALLRDARRPTVGEALKAGLAGLLPAIGVYLLITVGFTLLFLVVVASAAASVALAIVLGVALCVVAVYLMIKVSLALAVIAIEKTANPVTAMSRSWKLTKGNSFRLFLFFLLLFIVYTVISMVVMMIISALMIALGSSTAMLVNGVISGVLSALITVVIVAVMAAIHRQLAGPSAAAVSETFE